MVAIRPQSTRLTVFADFAKLRPLPRKSIAGRVKILTREWQRDVCKHCTRNWHRALSCRAGGLYLGLTDLFGVASTIALDQRQFGQTALRVTHWKPIDSSDANLSCVYDSAPVGSPQPRTVVIPPTMVNLPDSKINWPRAASGHSETRRALDDASG